MPKLREPPSRQVKPMPEIEEIEAAPTEEVTIDIGENEDGSVTIVEPENAVDKAVSAAEKAVASLEKSVSPEPSLKAALEAQKRAEELQAQAMRERDAAIQHARARESELIRERGDREQAQYDTVVNAIAGQQERAEAARRAIRAAKMAQDTEAELEALDALADARAELKQLEAGKYAFEARREQMEQTRREPPPQAPQSRLPKVAQDWLEAHPEYKTGWRNDQLGAFHRRITEEEGLAQFSPAYFERMETLAGIRKPEPEGIEPGVHQRAKYRMVGYPEPDPEPAPEPAQRRIPVSAPVSRDAPSAASGKATSRGEGITLSPEQREIAHKSITNENMSNAEKEKLYAIGLQKYRERFSNGYRDERHEQGGR